MNELVFATNNVHKLEELRQIVGGRYKILSLSDIGCKEDIPETGDTFEENARIKARYVKEKYGYDCFADDSGLVVDTLGGEPGVHSARYAPGTDHNGAANTRHLLENLKNIVDRSAHLSTVIVLIHNGSEQVFDGSVYGKIIDAPRGTGGFGYDPVFVPEGYDLTFAEMSPEEKNHISHRGIATQKLINYLKNI